MAKQANIRTLPKELKSVQQEGFIKLEGTDFGQHLNI